MVQKGARRGFYRGQWRKFGGRPRHQSKISVDLLRAGVAVITTGDHVWDQKDVIPYMPTEPRLLRPLNYPPGTVGYGSVVLDTAKGKVGVINVQGRTFMQPPLENPFLAMDAEVAKMREQTSVILWMCTRKPPARKLRWAGF